jgi:hypothetical protein
LFFGQAAFNVFSLKLCQVSFEQPAIAAVGRILLRWGTQSANFFIDHRQRTSLFLIRMDSTIRQKLALLAANLARQMIFRDRVAKMKLVEQLTLVTLQTAHHQSTSPRFASTQRNHASRLSQPTFATKSALFGPDSTDDVRYEGKADLPVEHPDF